MNPAMLEPFFAEAQKMNETEGVMFQWKKPLVSELDYWSAIETIGSYRHSTEHGFMKGHLDKERNGSSVLFSSARAYLQQKQLVAELWEKFGIVAPKDCPQLSIEERMVGKKLPDPPWGMRWYWNWYEEMKDLNACIQHESEVCSACPYSEGPGGSWIRCSLWRGMLYRLNGKDTCAMIQDSSRPRDSYYFTEDEFLNKMRSEHREESVRRFTIKREAIRILLDEHKR